MINVSDFYNSTAIEKIDIDTDDNTVSVVYKSNPNRVYEYVTDCASVTNIIRNQIFTLLNAQKDYESDKNSLGRYIYNLRYNKFLVDNRDYILAQQTNKERILVLSFPVMYTKRITLINGF